ILKTGQSGKHFTQFLLSVSVGEEKPTVVSGIAFTETAEKIAKLKRGDSISIVGALKNSEWVCKTTGNLKQGLSITVSASLSAYDIKKRRPKAEAQADQHTNNCENGSRYVSMPFNDSIPF
ncbi:MAG: single-stranded DNA-binding protein, partial [Methylococcales bacterium]